MNTGNRASHVIGKNRLQTRLMSRLERFVQPFKIVS